MNAQLSYLSKCVGTAQRMLMLPHPKGEAHDIASAMSEILQGLHGCNINDITDENGRRCLKRIQNAMDVTGLEDPDDNGYISSRPSRWTSTNVPTFLTRSRSYRPRSIEKLRPHPSTNVFSVTITIEIG